MLMMILGLVLFIGVHLVPTAPELRRSLGTAVGEPVYKIAFSLLSIVGLSLVVIGYAKLAGGTMPGKNPQIWYPPYWMRHITFLLLVPAMILLVAAYVPSRIRTAAKHPMLAAIKLWAFSHLLIRGDLASIILFGSVLAWALYDRISVKKRNALGPLGSRPGTLTGDVAAVAGGLAAYGFFLTIGHSRLIGVSLMPGLGW